MSMFMKPINLIVFVLIGLFVVSSYSQNVQWSPSQYKAVKRVLSEKASGYTTGYSIKQVVGMGDVSASILRQMFGIEGILRNENFERCLSTLSLSFARPAAIEPRKNRYATRTLKLLRQLKQAVSDEKKDSEIEAVTQEILRRTKKQ